LKWCFALNGISVQVPGMLSLEALVTLKMLRNLSGILGRILFSVVMTGTVAE